MSSWKVLIISFNSLMTWCPKLTMVIPDTRIWRTWVTASALKSGQTKSKLTLMKPTQLHFRSKMLLSIFDARERTTLLEKTF